MGDEETMHLERLTIEVSRVADALDRLGDAADIIAILRMQQDMKYTPGDPSHGPRLRAGQVALESLARVLTNRVNSWFGKGV